MRLWLSASRPSSLPCSPALLSSQASWFLSHKGYRSLKKVPVLTVASNSKIGSGSQRLTYTDRLPESSPAHVLQSGKQSLSTRRDPAHVSFVKGSRSQRPAPGETAQGKD